MFEMTLLPQSAAEHVDVVLSQIKPEVESHVLVPHWQSALFGVVPSVTLHIVIELQILLDLSQYEPAAEHLVDPH